jgi:PAS domain-containing protein
VARGIPSGRNRSDFRFFGAESERRRALQSSACALGSRDAVGRPLKRLGDSRDGELPQTSVVGVLEQCPVPAIVAADDGAVLFVNTAFAHLLGYSCDAITTFSYEDVCSFLPADETLFAITRLGTHSLGRLPPLGRATIFVKIRRSAIAGDADSDAVARVKGLGDRLSRLAAPRDSPL